MSVTYPRDLRNFASLLRRTELVPSRSVSSIKLQSGLQVLETGLPFWRGQFSSRRLLQPEKRRLEAFLHSLSGSQTFLAYSRPHSFPALHPNGVLAGGWSATLAVTATTATTITATAPNANLRISEGDQLGLEQGGRYGLHVALNNYQPAAGTIVMTVSPPLAPGLFTAGAVLRLERPVCEMILNPESPWDSPDEIGPEISFAGIQKVQ